MSRPRSVGLVVNPRSGSDVRRAIAAAGSSTLEDKISIIRRVVLSAKEAGVDHFVVHAEPHRIVERATNTIRDITVETLPLELTYTEQDSINAAAAMREAGCGAVVVLGGDGTNRAVVKGWSDVAVIPASTGTNNAFPIFVEATVAGAAAGIVARGEVDIDAVTNRAKLVHVLVDGEDDDIALIDAVAVDDPYVGSLDLFDPATMRAAMLTRAEPAAIGFSSVGGLLEPVGSNDDSGLYLRFSSDDPQLTLTAPTAPGHYDQIPIAEYRKVEFRERVRVPGPALLAFDGERKRRITSDQVAELWVDRDGPRVIDVGAVMDWAASTGFYRAQ